MGDKQNERCTVENCPFETQTNIIQNSNHWQLTAHLKYQKFPGKNKKTEKSKKKENSCKVRGIQRYEKC